MKSKLLSQDACIKDGLSVAKGDWSWLYVDNVS